MLRKLVVKYVPTYTKGTVKKNAKDLSTDANNMWFLYVFLLFFFLIFFIKAYVVGSSFELHRQVHAI